MIKNCLVLPKETEEYYMTVVDIDSGISSWFVDGVFKCGEEDVSGERISLMRSIGLIELRNYFSDEKFLIEDSEESETFSMVYGKRSLEIVRSMYARVNE